MTVATTVMPCCSSASSFATRRKNKQTRHKSPTKKTIPGSMICRPPLGTSPFQCSRRCEGSVSNTHRQKVLGEVYRDAPHHVAGKAVTRPALEALFLSQVLL